MSADPITEKVSALFPLGEPLDCHAVASLAPMEHRVLGAIVFSRLYPERFCGDGQTPADASPGHGGRAAK
ncbi:MAG: hypothetical protein NTY01_09270 [Verrucomicrobia bacterium]|nr:hypothetical protein [Verrucomicrobiota bacterium]